MTTATATVHVACPQCLARNRVDAARTKDGPKCGKCDTPLLDDAVVELDDARFDAFVAGTSLPVIVDFWASWCGPCRQMAGEFAHAAKRLAGRARLVKVDTDHAQEVARRFGVRSIPTLVLLKEGHEARRASGVQPAAVLERWVAAA